jgi:diaminopimelate decarboxylase
VDRIDGIARALGTRARVALRLNPDIAANSHPHISTGQRTNKFGVPLEAAGRLYREMTRRTGLQAVGVHAHIGSQILSADPLRRTAETLAGFVRGLRSDGITIEHVDLGGGVGISYDGGRALTPAEYADAVRPALADLGLRVLLEPGRLLVGAAGVLLTRVVDIKRFEGGRPFVVADAGMTELMRPALYGAFHRIEPVVRRQGPDTRCDVVGPLCESSDTIGADRPMPPLEVGDLLAVVDTGAYGFVMASNYNRRTLPAEVLVDRGDWTVIRRRQTIDDMVALED